MKSERERERDGSKDQVGEGSFVDFEFVVKFAYFCVNFHAWLLPFAAINTPDVLCQGARQGNDAENNTPTPQDSLSVGRSCSRAN